MRPNFRRRRLATVPPASTLTLSLVAARSSGIAPLYVHFDATGTTSTQTARPFHEVTYHWDFGDVGAGNWTKGAALGSKNTDAGPISGHVFETAGTFTVTLWAYDGVSVDSTTTSITVTAADAATEFLTTKTVVVNNTGDADFSAAPAGATQVNTDSLQTAMASLTGTVKRILFKRGGTWDTTAVISKNLAGPIQIGAYGAGALPKWRMTSGFTGAGSSTAVINIGSQTQFVAGDFRVMDIEIDGSLVADPKFVYGFYALGTCDQITVLRITYRSMTIGVNFSESLLNINERATPGQRVWDQLAIVDCTHLAPPNRLGESSSGIPYGDFLSAERFLYAGNDVDLDGHASVASQASHCLRCQYGYKGAIAHNSLANPGGLAPRHHVKLHGPVWCESSVGAGDWAPGYFDTPSNTLIHPSAAGAGDIPQVSCDQGGGQGYTRFVIIADNKLTQASYSSASWFISAQPQGSVASNYSRNKDQIIERNFGVSASTTGAYAYLAVVQSEQCTIRNNIAIASGATGASGKGLALVHLQSASAGWVCADTWAYNNSSYHVDGNSGQAEYVVGAGVTGTVIKNNLKYAPNDATGTMISDAGTGTTSGNNTTSIQTDPLFSGALTAVAGWGLQSGSYAKNAGAVVPVFDDLLGVIRPVGGTRDIGASEQ